MDTRGTAWWNHKNGGWDYRSPDTDEIAKQYIWQDDNAQAIYDIRREMGDGILEALKNTLEIQLSVDREHRTPSDADELRGWEAE